MPPPHPLLTSAPLLRMHCSHKHQIIPQCFLMSSNELLDMFINGRWEGFPQRGVKVIQGKELVWQCQEQREGKEEEEFGRQVKQEAVSQRKRQNRPQRSERNSMNSRSNRNQINLQRPPQPQQDQLAKHRNTVHYSSPHLTNLSINKPRAPSHPPTQLLRSSTNIYFGHISLKGISPAMPTRHGLGISMSIAGKLYEGYFLDNVKNGEGVQLYVNGNLYMGGFMAGKRHGKGRFYWFNGNGGGKGMIGEQIEGLERGVRDQDNGVIMTGQKGMTIGSKGAGEGVMECYDGQWWGGVPDGNGVLYRATGSLYTGTFKNGVKHGTGLQQYENGDKYHGSYLNSQPEGFGEYYRIDGARYRGDFKAGMRDGWGQWWKDGDGRTEDAMDGKMVVGIDEYGQIRGQRTIRNSINLAPTSTAITIGPSSQSQRYSGEYYRDKKSGEGTYHWQNGWWYQGSFLNDLRNGYGQLWEGSRLVYQGMWSAGQKIDQAYMDGYGIASDYGKGLRGRATSTSSSGSKIRSITNRNQYPAAVHVNQNNQQQQKQMVKQPMVYRLINQIQGNHGRQDKFDILRHHQNGIANIQHGYTHKMGPSFNMAVNPNHFGSLEAAKPKQHPHDRLVRLIEADFSSKGNAMVNGERGSDEGENRGRRVSFSNRGISMGNLRHGGQVRQQTARMWMVGDRR